MSILYIIISFYQYFVHITLLQLLLINGVFSQRTTQQPNQESNCCEDDMVIKSSLYPQGYLKSPPVYEQLNNPEKAKETVECIYTFIGKPGERIQLFYEDFDMYYPYDFYRFNKIDCRYADSICLKFYDKSLSNSNANIISADNKTGKTFSLENQHYDFCNCINVSYTPRQIISANNFLKVRFRSVVRSYESPMETTHSMAIYRGYLIRYKFTKDFGLNINKGGELSKDSECKVYFRSEKGRSGYFSSPNYPGLYPRDTECHYYFMGGKNERVQITFHTFDVEGIDMCLKKTKSDYIELSNFQNRDRFFSRYCGENKPGTVTSHGSFFHVTFYSNEIFDGKGFQASYYYINTTAELKSRQSESSAQYVKTTVQKPKGIINKNTMEQSNLENSSRGGSLVFKLYYLVPMVQFFLLKTINL